jgi:hypothetical protein
MASSLNGRVSKLEVTLKTGVNHCRACGLRHVSGPMTIAVLRSIIRVRGGTGNGPETRTPLCLCDPCCGDPGGRRLARLSHGLDAV